MLSAADLAGMRECANDAQPDTGVISRATLVSDGMGGMTETWATLETTSCRIDPPGNVRLDQWADVIKDRSVYILSVAEGTDIRSGDKLVSGGDTYLVIGLMIGSWEITRRAVMVML